MLTLPVRTAERVLPLCPMRTALSGRSRRGAGLVAVTVVAFLATGFLGIDRLATVFFAPVLLASRFFAADPLDAAFFVVAGFLVVPALFVAAGLLVAGLLVAGRFLAAVFLAVVFLTVVFLAGDFLVADFLVAIAFLVVGLFLAVKGRVARRAGRAFFTDFRAFDGDAACPAASLTAATTAGAGA